MIRYPQPYGDLHICPNCWAYADTPRRLNQHTCNRHTNWPRYLRACQCAACTTFRTWEAQRGQKP